MSFGIFFKKPARTISAGSSPFNCPITLPFRRSFTDRDYYKLGHYCEIGDGKFSLCAGWHSLEGVYGSNDWLGFNAGKQKITMRVMDFYHHDQGKIRENWVPIDILHILKQIGVDVLEKIKS